ncbi:MAG: carbamate kinase [Candidatus Eremiobacterota bacterium]
MAKIAVVAVGGNSLIKDSAHQSIPDQYQAVVETAGHIADMVEAGWEVVVTHGNGPQVGFILLRSELSRGKVHPVPLDVIGADTQGAIGYHLQQALGNEFRRRGMNKLAVTVVTQAVVDRDDPAFQKPSKPIGPFMTEAEARQREQEEGWDVVEDAGRGWRRVVASPKPHCIVELDCIKTMIEAGFVVIAVGGGGIPVVPAPGGSLEGVAAVIDKDLASSLLARNLHADLFVISTAVEKVCLRFGTPQQESLDRVTLEQARAYLTEGHFKAGSMKPKVEAVIAYLQEDGPAALITNPENLRRALNGETGTHFVRA